MVFNCLSGLPLSVTSVLVMLTTLGCPGPPGLRGLSSFLNCAWCAHRKASHLEGIAQGFR